MTESAVGDAVTGRYYSEAVVRDLRAVWYAKVMAERGEFWLTNQRIDSEALRLHPNDFRQ
jgi:hypothetical protein